MRGHVPSSAIDLSKVDLFQGYDQAPFLRRRMPRCVSFGRVICSILGLRDGQVHLLTEELVTTAVKTRAPLPAE